MAQSGETSYHRYSRDRNTTWGALGHCRSALQAWSPQEAETLQITEGTQEESCDSRDVKPLDDDESQAHAHRRPRRAVSASPRKAARHQAAPDAARGKGVPARRGQARAEHLLVARTG